MVKQVRSPRENVAKGTQIAGWFWLGCWIIGGFALALAMSLPAVSMAGAITIAVFSAIAGLFIALQLAKGLDFWPVGAPPKKEYRLKGLKFKKTDVVSQPKDAEFFLTRSDIRYAFLNLGQSIQEAFHPKKKNKHKKTRELNDEPESELSVMLEQDKPWLYPPPPPVVPSHLLTKQAALAEGDQKIPLKHAIKQHSDHPGWLSRLSSRCSFSLSDS